MHATKPPDGPIRISQSSQLSAVIPLRLPQSFFDDLQHFPIMPLTITFGTDSKIVAQDKEYAFETIKEEQAHDCFVLDNAGVYRQIGAITTKLKIERQLDTTLRDKVRVSGVEAERKRKAHKSALLEQKDEPKGKRSKIGGSVSIKSKPSAIALLKPPPRTSVATSMDLSSRVSVKATQSTSSKVSILPNTVVQKAKTTTINSLTKARNAFPLEEITTSSSNQSISKSTAALKAANSKMKVEAPVQPMVTVTPLLKGPELRERIIHMLALRDQNDYQIKVECKGKANHIATCLEEVATMKPNGLYQLRDELYSEIKVETWPHYSTEERVIVKSRVDEAVKRIASKRHLESVSKKQVQMPNESKENGISLDASISKSTNSEENPKQVALQFENLPPITTMEQYMLYKTKFQEMYNRYFECHQILEENQQHFRKLEEQWKNCKDDEKKKKEVGDQIDRDYASREQTMKTTREHYAQLHKQLAMIKQRIREYAHQ